MQDKVLLDALAGGEKKAEQAEKDVPLYPVIYEGTDEDIDRLIDVLQRSYARRKMALAGLGGKDGMRLTRAAFAVMLKFSDLTDDFLSASDQVAMEADMLDSDLGPAQQAAELLKILREAAGGDDIIAKFESASDMRRWISLRKKDLSEEHTSRLTLELKKKKLDAYNADQAKQGEDSKDKGDKPDQESKKENEPKNDEAKPAEDAQIDTSGSAAKKDSADDKTEKKDGDDDDGEKLKKQREELEAKTRVDPAEKEKIESEAFDLAVADLEKAYAHIVKKALFLVKLNVPTRFKKKDATKGAGALLVLNKATSSVRVKTGDGKQIEKLPEPKQMDWETRLKNWKSKQTSMGTIKSLTERQAEVWKAGISSIVALLQTPV